MLTAPLLLLLLNPAQTEPPQTLGFVEMLSAIRSNSKALAALRAQADAADAEVSKAWTNWQPNVNAVGTLAFNYPKVEVDFGSSLTGPLQAILCPTGIPGCAFEDQFRQLAAAAPAPSVIQPTVTLAGTLQLTQTLFNIAVLRSPDVAKAARTAVVAQVGATEDELFFQGASIFATLGGLKALEQAAVRAITVSEQRIKDAKAQFAAGTATQLVVTRAETDRTAAEVQKITINTQRQRLLATLGMLAGQAGPVDIKDEPILLGKSDGDYRNRSTLRAKELEVIAAEKVIGLWNMAWLPSLQVEAFARYTNFGGFADNNLSAQASINLVIPIYDQGRRYAETDIARARARAARHALEQAQLEARAFLEQSAADLAAAEAELIQAEAQLKLAQEAVTQAEQLVQNGLATNLELSDADSRRFAADQQIAQKKLALDLARLRLQYASGARLGDLLASN